MGAESRDVRQDEHKVQPVTPACVDAMRCVLEHERAGLKQAEQHEAVEEGGSNQAL